VRLLLVGESVPDPGGGSRRFFYGPTLDRRDNLFRGVVAALYEPIPRGLTGASKRPWLERMKADGVFLVDLVPFPVNTLAPAARRRARIDHAGELVTTAERLRPVGLVVCHGPTFAAVAPSVRARGLPLLHDEPIPFPLGNTRERFVVAVREALKRVPGMVDQ
jgi:hypothetical protein